MADAQEFGGAQVGVDLEHHPYCQSRMTPSPKIFSQSAAGFLRASRFFGAARVLCPAVQHGGAPWGLPTGLAMMKDEIIEPVEGPPGVVQALILRVEDIEVFEHTEVHVAAIRRLPLFPAPLLEDGRGRLR